MIGHLRTQEFDTVVTSVSLRLHVKGCCGMMQLVVIEDMFLMQLLVPTWLDSVNVVSFFAIRFSFALG